MDLEACVAVEEDEDYGPEEFLDEFKKNEKEWENIKIELLGEAQEQYGADSEDESDQNANPENA